MTNQYTPITTPLDSAWLRRVAKNSPIYLVKERRYATVEWEYDPRHIGKCGRIGLRFQDGYRDTWYINADGTGIDQSQCLLPVEGFLLEKEVELPSKYLNELTRRLEAVEEYIDSLKKNTVALTGRGLTPHDITSLINRRFGGFREQRPLSEYELRSIGKEPAYNHDIEVSTTVLKDSVDTIEDQANIGKDALDDMDKLPD